MISHPTHRLLLFNIKQLVTVSTPNKYIPLKDCEQIDPLTNYSIAIDHNGIISKVANVQQVDQWIKKQQLQFSETMDCSNLVAIPGLVDAHTHAIFAGDRSKQFGMKISGKSYVDIYNEGLGMRHTNESVIKASVEDLTLSLQKYLQKMSKGGTTTVQVKSGYGLNAEAEVKMLKAIETARLKFQGKIEVVSTFCGAHSIPKGKTEQQQTKDVIQNQIPAVQQAILNGTVNPKFIDVFCEKNFFQRQSSIDILNAGKKIGLIPSFHGDQLNNLQSGQIAAQVGARAVSHVQHLSVQSIKAMAKHDIVAVLLPTTQNIQKLPMPPIKTMREHNMIAALGSDFCPNAFCFNMALVCHLACINYRLTPKQALAAATINSAYALNLSDKLGSIEEGKKGDILLLDAPNWMYLVYMFGDSPIHAVIKQGKIIN